MLLKSMMTGNFSLHESRSDMLVVRSPIISFRNVFFAISLATLFPAIAIAAPDTNSLHDGQLSYTASRKHDGGNEPSSVHALNPDRKVQRFDNTKALRKCLDGFGEDAGDAVFYCKPSDSLEAGTTRLLSLSQLSGDNVVAGWIHPYSINIKTDNSSYYSSGGVYVLFRDGSLGLISYKAFSSSLASAMTHFADSLKTPAPLSESDGFTKDDFYRNESSFVKVKHVAGILFFLFMKMLDLLMAVAFLTYMFSMAKTAKRTLLEIPATRHPKSEMKNFSDIAGHESVIRELKEVKELLGNRDEKMRDMMPGGILLEGGPGNGKTLLAAAMAGEMDVPFYSMAGSDIMDMFVGVGTMRIKRLFGELRKQADGAVLFIDEIDAVAARRSSGGGDASNEHNRIVAALLNEMDGMNNKRNGGKTFRYRLRRLAGRLFPFTAKTGSAPSRIFIMAATNRASHLDPAITRKGRLDRIIHVGNPDLRTIHGILELHSGRAGLNFSEDVNLHEIARTFIGENGAAVSDYIREVRLEAWRRNLDVIDRKTLDDCVDDALIGHRDDEDCDMSHETRLLTARHEAGHCLVAMVTRGAPQVRKITIVPRQGAYGYVSFFNRDRMKETISKQKLEAQIMIAYGGRAAEETYYGEENVTTGAVSDISQASRLMREMVGTYGMSRTIGKVSVRNEEGSISCSQSEQDRIETVVRTLADKSYEKALGVIRENRKLMDRIVNRLLEHDTLLAHELHELFEEHGVPFNRFDSRGLPLGIS